MADETVTGPETYEVETYEVDAPTGQAGVGSGAATARFPPAMTSAREARRFVADTIGNWAPEMAVEVAVLLTSELVTNAVMHAQSVVDVAISVPDAALCVAVSDGSERMPTVAPLSDFTASGRGLALMAQLADAWGVDPTGEGKTVWFTLGGEWLGSGPHP